MKLAGRTVLITGGALRIGKAVALGLASRGANVAFSYRTSRAQAQATLQSLKTAGVRALAVQADITRSRDVKRLLDRTWQAFGRLDVLINSASNFYPAPYDRLTERDWDMAM